MPEMSICAQKILKKAETPKPPLSVKYPNVAAAGKIMLPMKGINTLFIKC